MRIFLTFLTFLLPLSLLAQSSGITGELQDAEGEPVPFANIALLNAADSSLVKVEASDEAGFFQFQGLTKGTYHLTATYVGAPDLWKKGIQLEAGQQLRLGVLSFQPAAQELAEATVTAERAIVEVKPDRTTFNVDGTINSVGADGLSLLRKAPGVVIDNNDNINVLGRAGVLVYVDGKRLPLEGADLSNYLQNLPAEQIDRIDIISNPGAKYEAEGNAGIIDIRMKKDKRLGGNGSLNGTYSQGRYARFNGGGNGNYRNEWLNIFGTFGYVNGDSYHDMDFLSFQNGLSLDEINNSRRAWNTHNYRVGIDFFLEENHTVGFLITGQEQSSDHRSYNRIEIAPFNSPSVIDSILSARSLSEDHRIQNTYNVNYRFDNKKGRTVNIDLDYGSYQNDSERFLRNRYYDAAEKVLLTQRVYAFDTPTDIDIYTATLDYEEDILGGKLSAGSKLSRVVTDNTFLRSDVINGISIQNDTLSNRFEYEENVYAGYINFSRSLGKKWNLSAGLRAEQTDATGDLQAFVENYEAEPVELNYLSWFPSFGLTWQVAPKHSLAMNYGRRINRPDYNVLNPFNNLISELSFQKGNPFLRPEIVNNVELGYTYNYMYNFKLAYSLTEDQITRLIAPDENDPRAGFMTWDNLAKQTIISFNASAPVQISKAWNAYMNFSASYLDNQADYGEGAVVDVQAFTYNIYQQHTFNLPAGFKGEVSGWFSGPGVWGGVFEYETTWSLDLGLQKKFLDDKLNLRLTVSDIFYQTGWDGVSTFDGLTARGSGRWDSRRGSLSLSYNFGNQNVKSRKRKTGLEAETERLGS